MLKCHVDCEDIHEGIAKLRCIVGMDFNRSAVNHHDFVKKELSN